MSNEVQKWTPQDLAYLNAGAQDAELEELRKEVNPFSVMPKLKLSNDTKEIRLILGEETIQTFNARNPLYFVPILMAESRALFRPGQEEGEKTKQPVCSTPRVPIGTFKRDADKGVGRWNLRDNVDLPFYKGAPYIYEDGEEIPESMPINCRSCKWNQFKTAKEWEAQKGSAGKACGESRFLVGHFCQKIGNVEGTTTGIYTFANENPLIYGRFSPASISAVMKIAEVSVGRRVPARKLVFMLGCEPKSDGGMKWGELTTEFVGYLSPESLRISDEINQQMRELVFVKQVDLEEKPEAKSEADDSGKEYSPDPNTGF